MSEEYEVILKRPGVMGGQQITLIRLRVQVHRLKRVREGLDALKRDNPDFDYQVLFRRKEIDCFNR